MLPPEEWLQPRISSSRLATKDDMNNFFLRLETALDDRGYAVDPRMRELGYMNIRNIFQRVRQTMCFVLRYLIMLFIICRS